MECLRRAQVNIEMALQSALPSQHELLSFCAGCIDSCYGTCEGSCSGYCSGSCSGTCSGTCSGYSG